MTAPAVIQPRPTRRTLVRATATAAWAVPVVLVATTAPAFAVSGPPLVTASGVSSSGTGGSRGIHVDLTNANSQPTTSLTLSVTLRATVGTIGGIDTVANVQDSGWVYSQSASSSSAANGTILVFNRGTAAQIAGNGTLALDFTIAVTPVPTRVGDSFAGSITAVPQPSPGTGVLGNGVLA